MQALGRWMGSGAKDPVEALSIGMKELVVSKKLVWSFYSYSVVLES